MCVELGDLYTYSVCDAGDCVEINFYEKRDGKEKDFEWGIAGEIMAKKLAKMNGVVCACYSPVFRRLCVRVCKRVEGFEATVRAIVDVMKKVMAHNMTPVGRAKRVLEECGICSS